MNDYYQLQRKLSDALHDAKLFGDAYDGLLDEIKKLKGMNESLESRKDKLIADLKEELETTSRHLRESDKAEYGKREALESELAALELENTKKLDGSGLYKMGVGHGVEIASRKLTDTGFLGVDHYMEDIKEQLGSYNKQLHEAEIRGIEKAAVRLGKENCYPSSVKYLWKFIEEEKQSCP